MDKNAEDFCTSGECPDGDGFTDERPPDVTFTADQQQHVADGGGLVVRDTRRSLLKKAGKLGAALGAIGVLGKVTVEKVDAATCSSYYCPYGKSYLQSQIRSSTCGSSGVSCWWLIKCWTGPNTYTGPFWCYLNCGRCQSTP